MDLLEAAKVINGGNSGWGLGSEELSRACAVDISLTDICENEIANQLIQGEPALYTTRPVGILGTLQVPVSCALDDDPAWLDKVLKDSVEMAVGRALVQAPAAGPSNSNDYVWIGADGVIQADPGNTLSLNWTDKTMTAQLVGLGRYRWFSHVASEGNSPLLHVPPMIVPLLVQAGVLLAFGDSFKTVWGDDVVMSPGYDTEGVLASPFAFWTGPINVTLSTVESTGQTRNARSNRVGVSSSLIALIDLPPCSIVRMGGAPTPVVNVLDGHITVTGSNFLMTGLGGYGPYQISWGDSTNATVGAGVTTIGHTFAAGTFTTTVTDTITGDYREFTFEYPGTYTAG